MLEAPSDAASTRAEETGMEAEDAPPRASAGASSPLAKSPTRIPDVYKRQDLCNETGLSYNTIASLFKRKSENISLEVLRVVAKYLGCLLYTSYLSIVPAGKLGQIFPAYGVFFSIMD